MEKYIHTDVTLYGTWVQAQTVGTHRNTGTPKKKKKRTITDSLVMMLSVHDVRIFEIVRVFRANIQSMCVYYVYICTLYMEAWATRRLVIISKLRPICRPPGVHHSFGAVALHFIT